MRVGKYFERFSPKNIVKKAKNKATTLYKQMNDFVPNGESQKDITLKGSLGVFENNYLLAPMAQAGENYFVKNTPDYSPLSKIVDGIYQAAGTVASKGQAQNYVETRLFSNIQKYLQLSNNE